jgi:maltose/moltooligosaccharide transporter
MVCFIVAFGFPKLAAMTSRKLVHGVSLALGGLSLLSVYFVHDAFTLQFSMIGIGIAWASILSMPYAILSDAIPSDRTGVYMGVFNFFIVIPEIVAALCFQPLVRHVFHNNPLYVVIMGGVSMLVAAALTARVQDAFIRND